METDGQYESSTYSNNVHILSLEEKNWIMF